jgi:Arc-like DNA binding dprotein
MTRIPEGLRRRLEREAKFRGRSMNAEIVKRLQESFDIPDQADAIVEDISSEIESSIDDAIFPIKKSLDELRSEIRTILAQLGLAQPKDDGEQQESKAPTEAGRKAALEWAIQTIEREGLHIARLKPDAAQPKDDGEKK